MSANEESHHKFLGTEHKKPASGKIKKVLPQPAKKALKPASTFYRRHPKLTLSGVIVAEVLLVVMLSLSIWGLLKTTGARDVSNQFVVYLKDNKVNAALQLVSPDFRRQDLSNFMNPIGPELAGTGNIYKQGPLKQVGGLPDYAVVYKLPTTSGGEMYVKVVLGQENGKWKIQDLKNSNTPLKAN